jgi:mRNA interferase HicA
MKKRDLEKELIGLGWWLKREGGNHEIWTNGEDSEPVPRHREVKENLAKKIIQVAKNNPPKKVIGSNKNNGTRR